ncbi:hypothetical protein IAR55_006144 [Kwoniella newhampshirensis]|uniref:PHD-type domain-containing protein n=1 Tax=Kwoniella newhampshirensis TaxID=1651941 RepID=A0AAW0YUI6_9TREE
MAGPVIYETAPQHTSAMPSHGQELMTDWTPTLGSFGAGLRREKESLMNDSRSVASPTYSHLSPSESNGHSSPYSHGQTIVLNAPTPSYHIPYPTLSGSHLQPMATQHSPRHSPLAQGQTYYPTSNGEYEVYQTPSRSGHSNDKASLSPHSDQTFGAQTNGYDGAPPLLTTTTLSRSYDSTIPSYYPPIDGRSTWTQATPDKEAAGQKRKREKVQKDTPTSGKALKTPKRAKQQQEEGSGRASKRVRMEESARPPRLQLPTPPSTGRDISPANLPPHLRVPVMAEETMTPIDEAPEIAAEQSVRRGLVITRHQEEGRKLGLLGVSQGALETVKSPEDVHLSPRTTTIPAITTDESGLATLATNEVLESEVAWFENSTRVHSPPSSPDLVTIQTPTMNNDLAVPDEDSDAPEVRAHKITKRLQAFSEHTIKEESPLVSTRIDLFGRVAVRKDTAIKFLGLDGTTRLVEETKADNEDVWSERPVASSSKSVLKPLWPDAEAPWALAGGSRKERMRREETEKAALLRRYLETRSDDSSDEEVLTSAYPVYGKGKGKSVTRLLSSSSSETSDSRRRPRAVSPDSADTNARSALLLSLRNRVVPFLPAGVVACVCGASSTNGMGSMISCASCKTWHHLMCCGIEDESKIGPNWWCSQCDVDARSMRTPAHSTPRSYTQADPRSSAVKSDIGHIALAPSPMFVTGAHMSSTRTPVGRMMGSPQRPQRARMLSYGSNDMWQFTEDGAPPSTPAPVMHDRYSTPRIDDAPFDVTSTPSRHLDFNFGQPSLFSLTPLGGRSRVPSTMLIDGTPLRGMMRNISGPGGPLEPMSVPSRADFFKELNKGSSTGPLSAGAGDVHTPVSPRWPHGLLGAHNLSPSPFGHKRQLSGNKMSSMRSSSRSGLGLGMTEEKDEE